MRLQVLVQASVHSAFAAEAMQQQGFSSGSSLSAQGSGQVGLPRRRRPTDPEGSSPRQQGFGNVSLVNSLYFMFPKCPWAEMSIVIPDAKGGHK